MLVLSGPSGSGKTAVLKMLARELGLTVLEWTNSVNPNSIIQRPQTPGNRGERSTTLDEGIGVVLMDLAAAYQVKE
jgi:ABC-type lipoprotein export system ATPase subunit